MGWEVERGGGHGLEVSQGRMYVSELSVTLSNHYTPVVIGLRATRAGLTDRFVFIFVCVLFLHLYLQSSYSLALISYLYRCYSSTCIYLVHH